MRNLKLFFLIFFIALTPSLFGQQCRLGFKLLPGMTGVHTHNELLTFPKDLNPRFTFNGGINFISRVKDSLLFIEAGLYFYDQGPLEKNVVTYYNTTNEDSVLTKTSDLRAHNYFLTLPILFRVEYKNLYLSFGPTINYYLTTKNVWTPEEDKVVMTNGSRGFFKDFSVGLSGNIGGQFRVYKQLGVFIEAGFNPSEFHWAQEKLFYNWNCGIGTGLTYSLK